MTQTGSVSELEAAGNPQTNSQLRPFEKICTRCQKCAQNECGQHLGFKLRVLAKLCIQSIKKNYDLKNCSQIPYIYNYGVLARNSDLEYGSIN
jgi:hypothetical protein